MTLVVTWGNVNSIHPLSIPVYPNRVMAYLVAYLQQSMGGILVTYLTIWRLAVGL